ncbi:hypothetical protein [Streptomyces sp. BH105]|uniref:hypothetical protein n=1 Tax=Streptomyces sp. BH105 TaxID=3410408 RepID=UPI003CFA6C5B
MIGIGTLAFTGVATYFSALVAGDQLDQSREVEETKAKEQASKVTTWRDPKGKRLHLQNRNPEPVSDVGLAVDYMDSHMRKITYWIYYPDIPPCSDTVHDFNDARYRRVSTWPQARIIGSLPRASEIAERDWKKAGPPGAFLNTRLEFLDPEGSQWVRVDGALMSNNRKPSEDYILNAVSKELLESRRDFALGLLTHEPRTANAKECGTQ